MAVLGGFGWFIFNEFPQLRFWESAEAESLADQRKNNPGEQIVDPEGNIVVPKPDSIKPKYRHGIKPLKHPASISYQDFKSFSMNKDPNVAYKANGSNNSYKRFEDALEAVFSWLDIDTQIGFAVGNGEPRDKVRQEAVRGKPPKIHSRFRKNRKIQRCGEGELQILMRIRCLWILQEIGESKTEERLLKEDGINLVNDGSKKLWNFYKKHLPKYNQCRRAEMKRIKGDRYPIDPAKNPVLKREIDKFNAKFSSSNKALFGELPLHIYKQCTFRDAEFGDDSFRLGTLDSSTYQPALFNTKSKQPEIGEYTQVAIGNCWFVAMTNGYAQQHPNKIREMVKPSPYKGFAEVNLYPLGFREKILVDYTLPSFKFDANRPHEFLWGPMIEKAFVKHVTLEGIRSKDPKSPKSLAAINKDLTKKFGWAFIETGNGEESFPLLSGEPAWHHKIEDGGLQAIINYLKEGYCLTAGHNEHDWCVDKRTVKGKGWVYLHEPNNFGRSGYYEKGTNNIRDGVNIMFPGAEFVNSKETPTGLFRVKWNKFRSIMATQPGMAGHIVVGGAGTWEVAKNHSTNKPASFLTERFGSAQGDCYIFEVDKITHPDDIMLGAFQATRRWADRVISTTKKQGEKNDPKIYYPGISFHVERPKGETAPRGAKTVTPNKTVVNGNVGTTKGRGTTCFGGNGKNAMSWTLSTNNVVTGSSKGTWEFFPKYRYFIAPTNAVDTRVNFQIYTRKGCGVKLSVDKAARRSFTIPFTKRGQGVRAQVKRQGGHMLFKIHQKVIESVDTNQVYPGMTYTFNSDTLRGNLSGKPKTENREQKVHFVDIPVRNKYELKCYNKRSGPVEIGVWWDEKVWGPPESCGKRGLQIDQLR